MLKTLLATAALLCASAAFASIEVNEANAAELDSIKGIGPATSTRILQARRDGVFKDWPDLLRRVKGLNAARLSREGLTVNGASLEPRDSAKK